jgi:hypothetical protein
MASDEQPFDRGFRLPEDGAPFVICGATSEKITREHHITISREPNWRDRSGYACRIYQVSDDRGTFTRLPCLKADFDGMTRAEWAAFKNEVDRAWDEYARRWPHPEIPAAPR